MDLIQYDEVLVVVSFRNPTHRNYVIALQRANLEGVFSGALNETVQSTVTSFRFAASPPSPTVQLSACSNASAGLVFQGRLGLGNPKGSDLTGQISVVMNVSVGGEPLTLSEVVSFVFTWNSEKKVFEATNEPDADGRNECTLPWLDTATMITRDWLAHV